MDNGSPRNVILVCLDSVRKDYFDSTATRVPQIADVSFEQCRAASSWSGPSYASMISGLLPHQHGVHTHSKSFESLPLEQTLFDTLTGYRTVGISSNVYAGPDFGFDSYFDKFVKVASHVPFPKGADPQSYLHSHDGSAITGYLSFGVHAFRKPHTLKSLANGVSGVTRSITSAFSLPRVVDEGARGTVRAVRNELTEGEEPTFMFISLMEGHLPHKPALFFDSSFYDCPLHWSSEKQGVWNLCLADEYDELYWTRRNQLYRAAIDYLDRMIEELTAIVNRQSDRETTIIVTADHGENHGTNVDEGLANHKSSLSESLLHVPLYLINPPEGYQSNEEQYFSHLSLPDLIEGISNGNTPDVFRKKVPAELIGMSPGPDPSTDVDIEYWDRMIRCGYRSSKKVTWDSSETITEYELDKETACWQSQGDHLGTVPAWASDLFDTRIMEYKKIAYQDEQSVSVGSSTEERLKELGYI